MLRARLEPRVLQAQLVRRVPQVLPMQRVLLVRRVLLGLLVLQVLPVQWGPQVQQPQVRQE